MLYTPPAHSSLSQLPHDSSSFGGNALSVSSYMMDETPSYFDCTAQAVKSHLHGHVLEVGCGAGNFTSVLAGLPSVCRVTAIDTEAEALLEAARHCSDARVEFRVADLHEMQGSYDSIICANVLEHIEDDVAALRHLCSLLKPSGTLVVLVPAHPFLYSRYDQEAGHFRRYTRASAAKLVTAAGLRIDRLFFFNMLGACGWFVSYKILQRRRVSESQTRSLIRIFDRFVLPVGRRIESAISPPLGLSVIALCRAPA